MSVLRALGTLLVGLAVAGAPALSYAQHSGGGHGGGGGAHFGGGGGGGGGGAHFGAGHYYGGRGGYAGGYAGAGGRYAYAGGRYAYGGGRYAYGGAHGYAATHYAAGYTAGRISAPVYAHGTGFAGGRGVYYGHGVWGAGRAWGGGYWHGVFWPRAWYYPGYAWWLAALPFGYATFWWGGIPYYYYNDLYYTYSPADNGYVVSEPPPAAGDDPSQAGSAAPEAAPAASAGTNLYLYPRNGQSDQQMANDRYECHSWAVNQTGFDPTHSGPQSGNPDDYRRAMISCLDARGYSAR